MTTSAAFGYRVGHPVALAYLETSLGEIEGLRIEVNIAGESFSGTASLSAAYDPAGVRLRDQASAVPVRAARDR